MKQMLQEVSSEDWDDSRREFFVLLLAHWTAEITSD